MDIQRLKFAWARGARLQMNYLSAGFMGSDFKPSHADDGWRVMNGTHFQSQRSYRIHPDDAHLEYGPISSALREAFEAAYEGRWLHENTCRVPIEYHAMAEARGRDYEIEHNEYTGRESTAGEHRSVRAMFYLFMAELLADEGL